MKQLSLVLFLTTVSTSWVSCMASIQGEANDDVVEDEFLLQRDLQQTDQCTGNFTYDFTHPEQAVLPPPSANCKTLHGNLNLISCLKANQCKLPKQLKNVQVIDGTLTLYNLASIPKNNFNSLNLLHVASCTATSLQSLSKVKAIPKGIFIALSAIESLQGLHNIEETEQLAIAYTTIKKSPPLKFKSIGNLYFANVPIQSLDGFNKLESVENLFIGLSGITSLDGLKSLKNATNIMIGQNGGLQSINLPKLNQNWLFAVGSNPSLKTISIPMVKNSAIVAIDSCMSLETIDDLGTYDNGSTILTIGNVDSLKSLQGLRKVIDVSTLAMYNVSSLETLDGLDNIANVSYLYFDNLESLKSLKKLSNIKHSSSLAFANIPMLEYTELDGLTHVGQLGFSNLPKLKAFKGLSNLVEAQAFGIAGPALIYNFTEIGNLTKLSEFRIVGTGLVNLMSIVIGTGNLGRPNIYISDFDQTQLKWKSTQAYLEKVCPKNSKITMKGCPGKIQSSVLVGGHARHFVTYDDLDIPTAEQIRDTILNQLPGIPH